jgi:hypothetical protein
MKRLVLAVIVLLAIFSVIRAYTQGSPAPAPGRGVSLSPGLVEVGGGTGTLRLAYGLMDSGTGGAWNMLPLRVVYTDGATSLTLSLNGFSFLLGGGIRVGRPVRVDSPRAADVISIGGAVTVDSRVEGDVWAFGADVTLTSRAEVTGNVVSVGGKVKADPKARVKGTTQALARLKLPFLGVLATDASAAAVELTREILVFILTGLVIFLAAYFLAPGLAGVVRSSTARWKQALLTAVIAAIVVPALVLLLVISVLGVFIIPFLVLAVLAAAYTGYLSLLIRLGAALRRTAAESTLTLFTSGALGLFIIKAPAIAGIVLALARSSLAGTVGQILRMVSLAATLALLAYGLGASLAHLRGRSRQA